MSESQCLWRTFYWATAFMVLRCQAKNLGFLLCPKAERNWDILVLYPIMLAEASEQIQKLAFTHCRKRFAPSPIAILVVDITRISCMFYSHVTFCMLFSLFDPRDAYASAFHLWSSIRFLCCIYMSVWIKIHSFQNAVFDWQIWLLYFRAPFITNSPVEIYPRFTYTLEKKVKWHSLRWFNLSRQLSPTQLLIHTPSLSRVEDRRAKVRKSWTEAKTG